MDETAVRRVLIPGLTDEQRTQMLALVSSYYRDPEAGLQEELAYGDRVYLLEADDGSIGSFLIVDLLHDETTIAGRPHLFTLRTKIRS